MTVDYFKEEGFSVAFICEILEIARSAYYKHKKRLIPPKEKQDQLLCTLIQEYHAMLDGILGYRRMTMYINRLNQKSFSEGYIHRLMQHMRISARIRRKKVNRKFVTPNQIADNILQRDFNAQKPNEKWLTDVTEFSISSDSKKLFLSPIMDLYDNSIIEYEL